VQYLTGGFKLPITIEIDEDIYRALQARAEPFVDKTPNDVLRRVFGLNGGTSGAESENPPMVADLLRRIITQDPDLEMLDDPGGDTYIHFAPRAWALPALMKGSSKSGRSLSFLFENRAERLKLNLEIHPGNQQSRRVIYESARNEPWFSGRSQLSPKWSRVFRKSIITREDYEIHGNDAGWIETRIREKMAEFKREVFPKIDAVIRGLCEGRPA
jgi:hypothetical protein